MVTYYFGKNANSDVERNSWLQLNKKLLQIALFRESRLRIFKYGRNHEQYVFVSNYKAIVSKNIRNRLSLRELRGLLDLFEVITNYKEDYSNSSDDMIDYLYSLVHRYLKMYEKEEGMRNLLSSTSWIFDEEDDVEDVPKDKVPVKEDAIKRFFRDKMLKAKVIKQADYKCEFDDSHLFFLSMTAGKNYVEGHHLVPLKFHDDFPNSLDVSANIVSLCVVCHKKLHHGLFEDKVEVLEKLFELRKDRLKSCNIHIDKDTLFSYYGSTLDEDD